MSSSRLLKSTSSPSSNAGSSNNTTTNNSGKLLSIPPSTPSTIISTNHPTTTSSRPVTPDNTNNITDTATPPPPVLSSTTNNNPDDDRIPIVASSVVDFDRVVLYLEMGDVNAIVPLTNGNCDPQQPCTSYCKCADFDQRRTLLHWAVAFSVKYTILDLIVRSGADLTAIDIIGDTPLDLAIGQGATDDVIQLLSRGMANNNSNTFSNLNIATAIQSKDSLTDVITNVRNSNNSSGVGVNNMDV
jgi:hypothetical protein